MDFKNLSREQIKQFFYIALSDGILPISSFTKWVDKEILDSKYPDDWFLSMSLETNKKNIIADIRPLINDHADPIVLELLLCVLRYQWDEKKIGLKEIKSLLYSLYDNDFLDPTESCQPWSIPLDCEIEDFINGYRSEEEIKLSVNEKLCQYNVNIEQINWLQL